MVLRFAELGAYGQRDRLRARAGHEVPRNLLLASVWRSVDIRFTPRKLEIVDLGLLADFANRGRECVFAGLDQPLRAVPVVVDAQQQYAPRPFDATNHDYTS